MVLSGLAPVQYPISAVSAHIHLPGFLRPTDTFIPSGPGLLQPFDPVGSRHSFRFPVGQGVYPPKTPTALPE